MKRLKYIGERPKRGSAIPLPEGWTMDTHDEHDETVAAAKLATGLYELAVPQGPEHLKERIRARAKKTISWGTPLEVHAGGPGEGTVEVDPDSPVPGFIEHTIPEPEDAA